MPSSASSTSTPSGTSSSSASAINKDIAALKYPPGTVISPRTGRPKRRKATRACVHCQRTHLTCDNNRPCERCVQRGLADTCRDGTRKKAKYLRDVPDSLAGSQIKKEVEHDTGLKPELPTPTQSSKSSVSGQALPPSPRDYRSPELLRAHEAAISSSLPTSLPTTVPGGTTTPAALQNHGDFTMSNVRGGKYMRNGSFQSTALNSEYKVLSDILGTTASSSSAATNNNGGRNSIHDFSPLSNEDSPLTDSSQFSSLNQFSLGETDSNLLDLLNSIGDPFHNGDATMGGQQQQEQPLRGPVGPDWLQESNTPKRPLSLTITDSDNQLRHNTADGSLHLRQTQFGGNSRRTVPQRNRFTEPGEIYTKVRKPHNYTPGYHELIVYLRSRFSKDNLLRMAKCMARYRPSFIACTNALKEDDLIFMEQCFQRTLMEYDNFIACSGTPTIVWRRTGEIESVGKEFCILTGWSRERLLNRRTFIVELMDDHSVVEYFETFSSMAFGDSRGAIMSECTLLTPAGQKLRTASTWTLQRDVFGIPMMIIGNFLPILS